MRNRQKWDGVISGPEYRPRSVWQGYNERMSQDVLLAVLTCLILEGDCPKILLTTNCAKAS